MSPRGMLAAAALMVLPLLTGAAQAAPDATRGAAAFRTECGTCHTATQGGPNRVGPNLWGIVGDKAAEPRGTFRFSQAMQNSGLTWDVATLARFMQKPRRVVPGTTMTFPGVDGEDEAADIAAYLATLQ